MQSEMAFKKETELCEEYPERKGLSTLFLYEWDLQNGIIVKNEASTTSFPLHSAAYSVELFPNASAVLVLKNLTNIKHFAGTGAFFLSLAEDLEAAHLIRRDNKICTHVFSTTPEIRLVLQQLLDCPPERKLRKLYLEGKVLELVSLFCEEAIGKQKNTKDISREDYRCLMKAREIIDNHFLHPFDNRTDCGAMLFSETKLKQGFKACFNCTVYEYIVEKAHGDGTSFVAKRKI